MKKLFEFTITKEVVDLQKESKVNENGETVTIEKNVKKNTFQKVFLRKPGRSLFDEAELFYGVKLSEGIKAGLLTRQLLAKRFSNDGGILSNDDKNKYADLYMKLFDIQNKIERLSLTDGTERTEEEKKNYENLVKETTVIKDSLIEFEMGQASLFDQTAENRARNKTILWWVVNLAHFEDEEGKQTPIFGSGTFDQKIAEYDKIEEVDDDFSDSLLKKLLYYVSFWYIGKAQTKEDFEELLKQMDTSD